MSPDPDKIREVMTMAERLEPEWQGRDSGTDRRFLPWMPYNIHAFNALLSEAMAATGKGKNRFLEIGAGIGTKMLLAREIFGLDVTGVEISQKYIRASVMPTHMLLGDAADCNYAGYDLIWFYRPFRDPGAQAALEKTVWDRMTPGAVVIGAGLEAPPPEDGFFTHLDDWERKRGIWAKLPLLGTLILSTQAQDLAEAAGKAVKRE